MKSEGFGVLKTQKTYFFLMFTDCLVKNEGFGVLKTEKGFFLDV